MGLTTAGILWMTQNIVGESTVPFDPSNAYIGFGDSNLAFDASQTDLIGTNKERIPVDTNYPVRVGNKITYKCTITGTQANFAWEEWALFNTSMSGEMLLREVEHNGIKQEGQTWIFEFDVDVLIGT